MKLNIRVVSKASTKPVASVCPWVMDIPPEGPRK